MLGAVLVAGAPSAALSAALRRDRCGPHRQSRRCRPKESFLTAPSDLTVSQQRIVDARRLFLGAEAETLDEAHGRSLLNLTYHARQSSLPSFHRLVTGLTLAQELLAEELTSRPVFDSPSTVADFLKLHFAGQPHESFPVMFLDARQALIAFEELCRGTLTQPGVYPREVMERALPHDAAGLVLAHNHPSGTVEPSHADRLLTTTLGTAVAMMDVRVVDHIIVAGAKSLSFAQQGLL